MESIGTLSRECHRKIDRDPKLTIPPTRQNEKTPFHLQAASCSGWIFAPLDLTSMLQE